MTENPSRGRTAKENKKLCILLRGEKPKLQFLSLLEKKNYKFYFITI